MSQTANRSGTLKVAFDCATEQVIHPASHSLRVDSASIHLYRLRLGLYTHSHFPHIRPLSEDFLTAQNYSSNVVFNHDNQHNDRSLRRQSTSQFRTPSRQKSPRFLPRGQHIVHPTLQYYTTEPNPGPQTELIQITTEEQDTTYASSSRMSLRPR